MNPIKRSVRAYMLLLGSFALVSFISDLPVERLVMMQVLSSVCYLFAAVYITLYFRMRIIESRVRKYLVAVGGMIVFWFLLRAAKYVAFQETEIVARFIWYLYYIPMLAIPQFSFMAALAEGEPEDKKLPSVQIVTGIISSIAILIVLTNDLHQLVFGFNPNFENWDADYTHETVYWIITVWNYVFFFFSTAVLFHKCRLSASRRLIGLPVVYLILGIVALYLMITDKLPRIFGNPFGHFPEIASYMLGGFWILRITIGLIPSNKGYGRLLQESSLAARITNDNLETVYRSSTVSPLTREQLADAGPVFIDENTMVCRKQRMGTRTSRYLQCNHNLHF